MCVIIVRPEGTRVPETALKYSGITNPHGFGLIWGNADFTKGDFTIDETIAAIRELGDQAYVAHYRYSTAGSNSLENTHPMVVLNQAEHGRDLLMVHNGTFADLPAVDDRSDTNQFVDLIQPRILSGELDVFNDDHVTQLGRDIRYSKLVFYDGTGRISIVNEKLGVWKEGVWYSNMYSILPPDHRVTQIVDDMAAQRKFHIEMYDQVWNAVAKSTGYGH